MGFSLKRMFSGKGWRKFKKVVGGVVGTAVSVVPGVGGIAGKGINTLLNAKGAVGKLSRIGNTALKVNKAIKRGKRFNLGHTTIDPAVLKLGTATGGGPTAMPSVMPGGAPVARKRRKRRTTTTRRKRRTTTTRRSRRTTKKRRTTTKRRRKSRLKFGSPAYRKKYLGHR